MTVRHIAMLLSPSDCYPDAPQYIVIGTPGDRRVDLFQQALAARKLAPARLVSYSALLNGHVHLADVVSPHAIVRIESPGKDAAIERALIAAGANEAGLAEYNHIDAAAALELPLERGRLRYVRQWYLGLCATLRTIEQQLAACPEHQVMNSPADIALMFDKPECHARLLQAGVAVPRVLSGVDSFDALVTRMRELRCPRVFVKPAHGSSAAGVIAYAVSGDRQQAITTVEMVDVGGPLHLYNSRRLRTYHKSGEIRALIDALCRERVHVQQWLPKAGINNRTFDLRVVVIGSQARHVVARLSKGPMTNLHLLNARGDVAHVQARMGPDAWRAAMNTCEQASAAVGSSLYAGVDLLISPGFRRHAVLELNAFGDLLPGVLHNGEDTYSAEIVEMRTQGLTPSLSPIA